MANRHRREVDCRIGGRVRTLRLTLNALAEIETAFGAGGLAGLGRRLSDGGLSAGDFRVLLGAALRGGGAVLDDEEVGALVGVAELPAAAESLGRLFALAFGDAPEATPQNP